MGGSRRKFPEYSPYPGLDYGKAFAGECSRVRNASGCRQRVMIGFRALG